MKARKSRFTLGLALTCAALTLSLAVRARAQTVDFVAQFSDDQATAISVIQGTDGNFYGTASGGTYDQGQVFRMTPSGELTTIYSFCSQPNCPDGNFLISGPTLGSDGNLYGVTYGGGSDVGYSGGSGTVYKMTLEGEITTLYTFCTALPCVDGQGPNGITQASNGDFYGTTIVGGKFNEGTVFQISRTGKFKLLYTFCSLANCSDGLQPHFPPVQASDGNFYGTAFGGGPLEGGVLYELTSAGTYKVLHNFCLYSESCDTGPNTGSGPSTVVQDAKGNFYGTTDYGGGNIDNYGTAYEFTSEDQYRVLHKFDVDHGDNPTYGLTLANDGNFYGVGGDAGYNGYGTPFEITPAGLYTPLYTFECCNDGYDPFYGPLFQGTNGNIYGTTLYGPGTGGGTIFSLSNNLSPLVETVPVAGPVGQSVLILGNGLTGSTSVKFNGTEAAYTVESDTYIKATVPKGATTGTVSVVTPSGTLNSNPQFVVSK
jgi:uncharacterized repeat protein (TIGR03803 family)